MTAVLTEAPEWRIVGFTENHGHPYAIFSLRTYGVVLVGSSGTCNSVFQQKLWSIGLPTYPERNRRTSPSVFEAYKEIFPDISISDSSEEPIAAPLRDSAKMLMITI